MRKTSAVLATLCFAAVVLTGCATGAEDSYDGASCDRAASTSGVDDLVTVTGDFDQKPTVTMSTPLHVDKTAYTDLTTGEGTPVTRDDQYLAFDFALYGGDTGTALGGTSFTGDSTSNPYNIATVEQSIPGLATVLRCVTPGTRVLAAISPDDAGQLGAQIGLADDESIVAVIDVTKTYLPHAEGTLEYNDAKGMPTVVRASDGRPGIIVPTGATPPEDLTTQTLIKGDGDTVQDGSTLRVQYTGLTWKDGKVFQTSWDTGAVSITLGSTIEGFTTGLVGQTVGSQVLLVIPPDLGYGDEEKSSIPANSTLVFVVDILGIDAPSSGQ